MDEIVDLQKVTSVKIDINKMTLFEYLHILNKVSKDFKKNTQPKPSKMR
jgi:hypothetical protein